MYKDKEKNIWTVYAHENKKNSKKYVGITSRSVKERWSRGNGYYRNQHFYRSIQKYGWDGFEHIVLFENLTFEEAAEIEKFLISKYNLTDGNYGYNISLGGEGRESISEETREKIRLSKMGLVPSEETKEKIRQTKIGSKNPNYANIVSEETRKKISSANKGKKLDSYEYVIDSRGKVTLQYTMEGKYVANYRSTGQAELETGVDKGSIKACCNNRYTNAGGFIWKYESDIFKIGEDLEKKYIKKKSHSKEIYQCDMKRNPIRKFKNATEAGRIVGSDRHDISDCCNKKRESLNGFLWIYAEELEEDYEDKSATTYISKKETKVIQYTLNHEYIATHKNYTEAFKTTGIGRGSISLCCRGLKEQAGGYLWELC